MATITTNKNGAKFSVAGDWDLARVPANTDAVVIAHTGCIFDQDQSGFAAGIGLTINANCNLHFDTAAAADLWMKLSSTPNLSTAGCMLYCGNSNADRVPRARKFTIELAGAAVKLSNTAFKVECYGWVPTTYYTTLTAPASNGASSIVVADHLGDGVNYVRAGDQIIIGCGDSPASYYNADQTNYYLYDVTGYDSGTKTISISPVLAGSIARAAGDYVGLLTRSVQIKKSTDGEVVSDSIGGYYFDGVEFNITGNGSSSYVTYEGNRWVMKNFSFHGSRTAGAAGLSEYSYNSWYENGVLGGRISAAYSSIQYCNVYKNLLIMSAGGRANIGGPYSLVDGCIFQNCYAAFAAGDAGTMYSNNIMRGTYYGNSYPRGKCMGYNNKYGNTAVYLDNAGMSYSSDGPLMEDFNKEGTANNYQAYLLGGLITTDTGTTNNGHSQSYKMALVTTSVYYQYYPVSCYREYLIYPIAGRQITAQMQVRKSWATGGSITLQIIDPLSDPKRGGAALATATIGDALAANTWYTLTCNYTPAVANFPLIVRISSQNGTTGGNVWFDDYDLLQGIGYYASSGTFVRRATYML